MLMLCTDPSVFRLGWDARATTGYLGNELGNVSCSLNVCAIKRRTVPVQCSVFWEKRKVNPPNPERRVVMKGLGNALILVRGTVAQDPIVAHLRLRGYHGHNAPAPEEYSVGDVVPCLPKIWIGLRLSSNIGRGGEA